MPDNQEDFKLLLKQNGLKVTTQRVAILEALKKRPGCHLTAEEIYDCVKEEYPEIGLATVYRTVQLLSDLNVIDKLSLDDGYIRYEIGKMEQANSHHHHHLICLNCGKVFAFEDDLLETLEERIRNTLNFQVVDHEVKLFGYCKNCNEQSNNSRKDSKI